MTVAALYVETNGVYYGLPDVDPWDEARDARLYDGPWPVVAHPPCARPTWLYCVGPPPPPLIWGRAPNMPRLRDIPGRGKALWRSRTPPAFRDVLLAMARSACKVPA